MGLLSNLNLPLPQASTVMGLWLQGGLIPNLTWLFSDLDQTIAAAPGYYDETLIFVAPVADSANWVWSMEPA